MAVVNTECGINDCIVQSLGSPYYFRNVVYQHLSAKKHTVMELASFKKLGYRQNDITAYLYKMNDMSDLFSGTEKFKGHIYKCQAGTISQACFKCLPNFSDWGVDSDPTVLYRKILQALKMWRQGMRLIFANISLRL